MMDNDLEEALVVVTLSTTPPVVCLSVLVLR